MEKVWFNGKRFYLVLRKNLFFSFFSFFFLSQTTPTAFLVVVKRPPLHFLGDLTQALLRELAREKTAPYFTYVFYMTIASVREHYFRS